jgi:RNA polymerase sigma factor (sigma-70 family)
MESNAGIADEAAILTGFVAGDAGKGREFVRRLLPLIRRLARANPDLVARDLVEDAVNEAVLLLLERRRTYREDGDVRAFLRYVVRHAVRTVRRQNALRDPSPLRAEAATSSAPSAEAAALDQIEARRLLATAAADRSALTAPALVMIAAGMTWKESGDRLAVDSGALRYHLERLGATLETTMSLPSD